MATNPSSEDGTDNFRRLLSYVLDPEGAATSVGLCARLMCPVTKFRCLLSEGES